MGSHERFEPRLFRDQDEKNGHFRTSKRGQRGRFLSFRFIFFFCLKMGLLALVFGVGLFFYLMMTLQNQGMLEIPKQEGGVVLLASNGEVIAERGLFSGDAVRLDELPTFVPQAVIAVEDRRFYSHFGVDLWGIGRALLTNIGAGRLVQGGSTLTQQLAKNLFLKPERTLKRKIYEVVLALWLENHFTKDEILQLYLNRVYYGAGATGIEKAAQRYFDKSAQDLTLHQAAVLAALLKAPTAYNPLEHLDKAQARAKEVLGDMVKVGFITKEEAQEAEADPLTLKTGGGFVSATQYIMDWVIQTLPSLIGVHKESLVIETTIDQDLQKNAESSLRLRLLREGRLKKVSQGAVVVLDMQGQIKALVGGRSYGKSQYNRAIFAKRQPGSAFKAFVYLTALEQGATPDTVESDEPVEIGKWSPENYKRDYKGEVTLEQAYAESLNTVAAKLGQLVGTKAVIATAQRLGISSPLQDMPSLALGTSEVSLLELTSAYTAFANGGYKISPYVILKVSTKDGQVLYTRPESDERVRVLEPALVGDMNTMMRAVVEQGTGKRARLQNQDIGGKTGTSQDYRDAWFIGYSSYLIGGVWVGNDDNRPTAKMTGGGMPSAIWSDIMAPYHKPLDFIPLAGTERSISREPFPEQGEERRPQPSFSDQPSDDRNFFDTLKQLFDPSERADPSSQEEKRSRGDYFQREQQRREEDGRH